MKQDTNIRQDGILYLVEKEVYLFIPKPDPVIYDSEWFIKLLPEIQSLFKMFPVSSRLTIQDIVYKVISGRWYNLSYGTRG